MDRPEKIIKSVCKSCHGGCGVLVKVKEGKIAKIKGNPDSFTRGTMCLKGLSSLEDANHPQRVLYPMKRKGKRGGCEWERISWNEALDTIANRMKEATVRHGARSIAVLQGTGRGYNRYTFRFARSLGTPNIGLPAHFCYGPRLSVFGMMVGGRLYCDYHGWGGSYPKTQISWGKQLEITNADGEMAVWFLDSLKKAKHLILIDPRATRLAPKSDLWLKIRPGTDGALALAMLHVIIHEQLYDKDFVRDWTYGFDQLSERVRDYPPERAAEITWVPKDKIVEAARIFALEKPGCIQIGEALEASIHTIHTLMAIVSLMAITGNIERPGGMVNWIPPDTGPMEDFAMEVPPPRETPVGAERFRLLNQPPFAMCHLPTVFKELSEDKGTIKLMHIEGSNPLVAYENTKVVMKGLLNLEFLSVADLYMSPTAEYADIVLPVAHWLETDDIYDMHPRFWVGAINKAREPRGEAWPDNKIFNELGKRIAPDYWFQDVEEMLNYQLRKAKIGWSEFSQKGVLAKTGSDQVYYKYKTDYWRKGGGFRTKTGKVELYSTLMEELGYDPLPNYCEPAESPYSAPQLEGEYPFILSTGGRIPYYFHSQYRQILRLRSRQPNPLVQIHPKTADRLGIKSGDWVWIETERGRIKQVAQLFEGMDERLITVQASWYFPEFPAPDHGLWESNANVLTSNGPSFDPAIGATPLRSLFCKIYKY
ncbi:MAG: molybdopterin oxidoreductase [Deltaproteobacteria bacterium]|nr:molybdopterin oxidoreductase [Deltaproteobacteria bacterium]